MLVLSLARLQTRCCDLGCTRERGTLRGASHYAERGIAVKALREGGEELT